MKYDLEQAGDVFDDIVSSGQFINEISESAWHKAELKKLIKGWTPEQKVEFWNDHVHPGILNSDGWSVGDMQYLMKLLGVKEVTLTAK